MGITRLILILIGIWVLFTVLRRVVLLLGSDRSNRNTMPRTSEKMVACAHCGTYVPVSEALFADADYYCSPEHRRAGRAGD